jgi:hypothetical protein
MGKLGLNSGYIGSDQRTAPSGSIGYDKFYLERTAGRFYPLLNYAGLLDVYPGAAAAYSLRLLRAAYTGNAIRVRRSSDNAETDIGFSNNGLNTATLTSFCGASNGYITTWYDQSGNGINAIQTTATNQPQIVSSGTIYTKNGKPTVDFSTQTSPVTLDATLTSTNSEWTVFGVITPGTILSSTYYYGRWISVGTPGAQDYSNTNSFLGFVTSQAGYGVTPPGAIVGYNSFFTGSAVSYNTQYVANVLKSGNTVKSGVNNVLNSGFPQVGTLNASRLRIGANITWLPEINSNFYGTIQEIIYYQTDQTTNLSNINTNINTYYGTY